MTDRAEECSSVAESGGTASPKSDGLRKSEGDPSPLLSAINDLVKAANSALGFFDALVEEPHHPGEAKLLDQLQTAIAPVEGLLAIAKRDGFLSSEAPSPQSEAKPSGGNLPPDEPISSHPHPDTGAQGARMGDRRRFFCADCDDWRPGINCPDCGERCVVYVGRGPYGRLTPLSPPTSEGERADGEGSR